jgi:hypothetical protein
MPDARDANGHLIRELHGVTLASILDYLVAHYGFTGLDERLRLNCFASDRPGRGPKSRTCTCACARPRCWASRCRSANFSPNFYLTWLSYAKNRDRWPC